MGGGTYWRRYGAYVIRALTALISIQKLINCAILERGAARRGALYQIITGKLKIDDINPQFINKYTWVLINKSSYTVVCSMQNPLATLAGKHIIVNWQAWVSIRKYRQLPFYCRDLDAQTLWLGLHERIPLMKDESVPLGWSFYYFLKPFFLIM